MKILIEAHHPAHIHFWKYPIRELIDGGDQVRLIGRDRDVMRRLLEAYDWIPSVIPVRRSHKNKFPIAEMLQRQWTFAQAINDFKPDVVGSLMGSYTQSAKIFGTRNIIFTDTETQAFNHKIAHPFADEIHTPSCFLKDFGKKHSRYEGLHEQSYLNLNYFKPNPKICLKYGDYEPGKYLIIRMSAWNTFHDHTRSGIGDSIYKFVEKVEDKWKIILSAEEGKVPPGLEKYAIQFDPVDFHDLLANSFLVLTEGASTASEAACLGVPSVFINSVGDLGNFKLLSENYQLIRNFQKPEEGIPYALDWLDRLSRGEDEDFRAGYESLMSNSLDVCRYIVDTFTNF